MRRLRLALVGIALLTACSHRGDREPAGGDRLDRPLEDAKPDSGAAFRRTVIASRPGPAERPLQLRARPHPPPPTARAPAETAANPPSQPPPSTPIPSRSPGPDTTSARATGPASDTVPTPVTPVSGATTAARDPPSPLGGVPEPSATSRPSFERALALPTGTIIRALLEDSISSRHDSAGKVVMARINTAITDRNGQVVVPADSPVQFSVTQLEPAKSRNAADGQLALQVDSVLVEGRAYPVSADVQAVPHELRGRGVSAGEAEKVGVGAAAGAVLGRVLGGNTKGTVIGGVVGAAGGAVVAAQTASRDVVVAPGTWVSFALTAPLVVKQ